MKRRVPQILLTIGIAAGVGLLVWNVWFSHNTELEPVPPKQTSQPNETVKIEEPKESEKERVSSPNNTYSVEIPDGWVSSSCNDVDVLFLAPSPDLLGKCNSGFGGAISISRNDGDVRSESNPLNDPSATEISESRTTLGDQQATRTSYTIANGDGLIPDGTTFVRFQTFYNNSTYTLVTSHSPNASSFVGELDEIASSFRFED